MEDLRYPGFHNSPSYEELCEIKRLCSRKETRSEGALKMCEVMHGFVLKFISDHYRSFLPKYREDFISCCFLGIMQGLDDYDPGKGTPSTWFKRYMLHECELFIEKEVLGYSMYYAKKLRDGKEVPEGIAMAAGRIFPDDPESPVYIEDISSRENTEETFFFKEESAAILSSALSRLSKEEFAVITMNYGLDGEKKRSNTQIAKILDIPVKEVDSLKRNALLKLKKDPALW